MSSTSKEKFFFLFFLKFFIYYFYFWLCWVFVSVRGLSLVAASGSHSSSRCAGLSLSRPLLLWSTGSRRAGSVVVAHGPSCSAACGIFPDQGSNPCPLHGRQILNHCATREAPRKIFNEKYSRRIIMLSEVQEYNCSLQGVQCFHSIKTNQHHKTFILSLCRRKAAITVDTTYWAATEP